MEIEKKQKSKLVRGAYALVRRENAVSSYDLSIVNGFYKRVVATGVFMLFHSATCLNFAYQARFITYERFPRLYPRLQYIWYPTLLGVFLAFIFRKHSQLMKQLDEKYTPLWHEISDIYQQRELEKQRALTNEP